jgi:hypothetical protein
VSNAVIEVSCLLRQGKHAFVKSESDYSESNPYRPPTGNELPVEVVQNLRVPGPVTMVVVVGLALLGGGAGFFFTCLGAFSVGSEPVSGFETTAFWTGCSMAGLLAYTLVVKACLAVLPVANRGDTVRLSWRWLLLNAVLTCIVTVVATVIFTFFGGLIIGPAVGSWILYAMHRRQANAARGTTNTQSKGRPWSD